MQDTESERARALHVARAQRMYQLAEQFKALWMAPNTEPEAMCQFFTAHGLALLTMEKRAIEERLLDWICEASCRDDALPHRLALFARFMRQFDGRFELSNTENLYTALCKMGSPYFLEDTERNGRQWFTTVAAITRFLADELHLPMASGPAHEYGPLWVTALRRDCWPVYAVLAERFPNDCNALHAALCFEHRHSWGDLRAIYLRMLAEHANDEQLRTTLAAQERLRMDPDAVAILRAEAETRNRDRAARVAAFSYAGRAVSSRLADVVSVRELRSDITRRAFGEPLPFS